MSAWQDVLVNGSDQLTPCVISPTMDGAIVDAARTQLLAPHAGKPGMHAYVAELTAQFLTEQVARYGTRLSRTAEQAQAAEVRAEWAIADDLERQDDYYRQNPRGGAR